MDGSDEEKQTNEIKVAAPMLDSINIKGKTITADALLTQREFATYIVGKREANYHLTVKGNQKNLLGDIKLHFKNIKKEADYIKTGKGEHGRIETRKIWTTTELNDYLDFPYVRQVFMIERESVEKKTGKKSHEIVYGVTSIPKEDANAERVLEDNRGHWSIESCHYMIDWNYDEDRSQIRTLFGPENITRLRPVSLSQISSNS